jgi:DNA-binding NarL/FixJ family response regulator
MQSKTQIIIVDDNPTFLEGITTFLSLGDEFEIVALFSTSRALLDNINDYDPDVILLDIEMPAPNGIETARLLSFYGEKLKLIAITMYHDHVYLKQLIKAGFRGFVHKNQIGDKLRSVIERVINGELAFPDMEVE